MNISVQNVREIVEETALKGGVPPTFDETELADDVSIIGKQFLLLQMLDSEKTGLRLQEMSTELVKRARALVEVLEGFPEGTIPFNRLGDAANEWALGERQSFLNLEPKRYRLPELSEREIPDLRGHEFIARLRLDLAQFAQIVDFLLKHRRRDAWSVHSKLRISVKAAIKQSVPELISPERWLIGKALPTVYAKHFKKDFRVSVSPKGKVQGPGLRFVRAALNRLGVKNPENEQPYADETIRSYWRKLKGKEVLG